MSETVSEAYVEGFCKAAEAAGVDPEVLLKSAQRAGLLQQGIGWLGKHMGAASGAARKGFDTAKRVVTNPRAAWGRYKELMGGGNAGTLANYNAWRDGFHTMLNKAMEHGVNTKNNAWLKNAIDQWRQGYKAFNRVARSGDGAFTVNTAGNPTFVGTKAVANELGKVRAARIGTGAVAGTGLLGGMALMGGGGNGQGPDQSQLNA